MKYTATVEVERSVWEAMQASFHVGLREDDEAYNEEIIDKYDLRAGTNPASFVFEFKNGTEIAFGWYVEEFGGVVEWGDFSTLETLDSQYELDEETEFTGSTKEDADCHYICKFIIKD